MNLRMVSLKRAPNGDWFARKAIPANLRDDYKTAHGVALEERLRRPASLSPTQAKQELREWDAEISARIHALRSARAGEGQSLTRRQAHALAGEWYVWFVSQHEEEPGTPEQWDGEYERVESFYSRFAPPTADHPEVDAEWVHAPAVRRHVRAKLIEMCQLPSFLAEQKIVLTPEAHDLFVDIVEEELVAALALLRRRAGGDFTLDARPQRFPKVLGSSVKNAPGVTCWELFAAWVKERRPAVSTITRWRSVFLALEEVFKRRSISSITKEDAIRWKGTLVTEARSPEVANDIWLTAARTVFEWAQSNQMTANNPFDGVSVATRGRREQLRSREFTDEECGKILTASLQPQGRHIKRENADARRWVPWLCAYTGSRAGEVTQLRVEDVQEHQDGFWTMRITPEAGAVKMGGARIVPLHDHVIEQGFIEFVKAKRSGPLFYDQPAKRRINDDPLKPVRPAWVKAREKLAEWVRTIGVKDPNISPNHGWRHTFKRRAARAHIEPRVRDAMCGHTPRHVGDQYETPSVKDLALAMKKFPRYSFDVS